MHLPLCDMKGLVWVYIANVKNRRDEDMPTILICEFRDHAAEHDYGSLAFNVSNMEQMRAIIEAAEKTENPVIAQILATPCAYVGAPFLNQRS